MNLRNSIKKILKENINTPSKDKFIKGVLNYTRTKLYQKYIPIDGVDYANKYPTQTLEGYISVLNGAFKNNNSIVMDKVLNDIYNVEGKNPLLDSIDIDKWIKWVYEFLINFNNSGKRIEVDVIPEEEFFSFFNDKIFNCDDSFFEFVWDKLIGEGRNYWNENLKDKMWGEIEDEVIEKMEDEEWQEENGVSFDGLEREKSYFMTYWHYPIDSLGWRKDDLCELYKDTLEMVDRNKLSEVIKFYETKNKKKVYVGSQFFFILDKNLFF